MVKPLREQRLLAVEGIASPRVSWPSRRRQRGLGRAQGVQLVLRVEPGQDLAGLDAVADIDHRSIMRPPMRKASDASFSA